MPWVDCDRCRAGAIKGRAKCRHHGGRSTGPKTEAGRQRIADAELVHGRETRTVRAERSLALARLAELETTARASGGDCRTFGQGGRNPRNQHSVPSCALRECETARESRSDQNLSNYTK